MSFMEGRVSKRYSFFNTKKRVAEDISNCYSFGMDIKEIRHKNFMWLIKNECNGKDAEMARRLGKQPAQVGHLVRRERSIGHKIAREIEEAFNREKGWLDLNHGEIRIERISPERKTPIATTIVRRNFPLKTIPVVGTTQGGPDRSWLEEEYPTGWGTEFAELDSEDPHAYILRVEGESMSPRINEGDYVMVEPSMEAKPGDTVVVILKTGSVMLKYLRAEYDDEVVFESHNHGFSSMPVPKKNIEKIHPVGAIVLRRKIKKRL